MSDDRGTVSSSAPLSDQEVERTRRLALTRLDELEASFHRVSERLVSVEARLGELAEDLRVRVTALQQQTRDAVNASLQMLAPQREPTDITAGLEEIRAVVRADVQEIAASIRSTFVDAERRLLEEQAAFLERAGATGEDLAARTDGLSRAVESMRQEIASTGAAGEVRASIDALRQEVAAATSVDELRSAIESLRAEVAGSSGTEDLQQALQALRDEVVAATSSEDVRQEIRAVREEMAGSKEDQELREAIAELRQQVISSGERGDVREAVESLRQDVAARLQEVRAAVSEPAPAVDLTDRLEAFQEELRSLGDRIRGVVATGAEGAGTVERDTGALEEAAAALTTAVAGLGERADEIARRVEALDQRSASVEERTVSIDERLAGGAAESGARFASALEATLSTIERRLAEFQERLDGAVQSMGEAASGPEGDSVVPPPLDEHLGELRERVEESVKASNLQTMAQVEEVKGEIERWMIQFGDVLEGSLNALRQRLESAPAGGEELRTEVGAMAQQVQEQMKRLETSVQDLRDRVSFAGPGRPEVAEPPAEPAEAMEAVPAEEQPDQEATAPAEDAVEDEARQPEEPPPPAEPEPPEPPGSRPPEGETEPVEPAPAEADRGTKKLPDIWSWGPSKG